MPPPDTTIVLDAPQGTLTIRKEAVMYMGVTLPVPLGFNEPPRPRGIRTVGLADQVIYVWDTEANVTALMDALGT